MNYQYNDGGRVAAGFKGKARDCVARAIAIAAELPYARVYSDLDCLQKRARGNKSGALSAAKGIQTKATWFKEYMRALAFVWVPTMGIGTGCKVHLCAEELPKGRLVVNVSRHSVAVIDGVVHDNHDSTRGGKRCVYGYWQRGIVACTHNVQALGFDQQ